jgi:radical SAM enzyme (TIGR01210 family)
MNPDNFLERVGLYLHQQRPKVPESLHYTIGTEGEGDQQFVQLWFRTRGCRHSVLYGGCTMCDYWVSDPVAPEQMVAAVQEGLNQLKSEPGTLLLNASGSVFDDWEVPQEARQEIFRLLSRFQKTALIFETHASTLSENKMNECVNILHGHEIEIEFGLESANPYILEYCLNKKLQLVDVTKAISILKKYHLKSSANILIGAPFLTTPEIIDDVLTSIYWAFEQGVDECVLFPVNLKPWTLAYWLHEHNMYSQPSLWTLIEILSRVDPKLLPSIYIAWYKPRPQFHPAYTLPNQSATTCPLCYDTVIELLDRYISQDHRRKTIEQLINIRCYCKNEWCKQIEVKDRLSLTDRVQKNYSIVRKRMFGEKW